MSQRSRSFTPILLVSAAALFLHACRATEPLPELFALPAASLTSHEDEPLDLADLAGQVVIYDFIFTHCAGTCPMMTRRMADLTKKFDADAPIRFVSITVDPTRDTPEVLRAYKEKVSSDPRWVFLTGNRDKIIELSVGGFKLAAGDDPQPGGESLLHSSRFVLADQRGIIRGYYDTFIEGETEKLIRDARSLL